MSSDSLVLDYYRDRDAKAGIHNAINSFLALGGDHHDLGRYESEEVLMQETVVIKDDRGVGYLARKDMDGVEAMISMTAVLAECNLPPYRDAKSLFQSRRGKKDIPVNRVSLAWYGHPSYDKARVGLENIRTQFSLKYDTLDKINDNVVAGEPALTSENRVVSKVDQVANGIRDADFPKAIDPNNVIRTVLLSSPLYRYVEDNAITYSKLNLAENVEDSVAQRCSPEEFKVGMVVCVQATPCVVPTVKHGYKVMLKLRNILCVSDEIYKKYVFAVRVKDVNSTPKPGGGLKRAATEPEWIPKKKRTFTMGDVRMRDERALSEEADERERGQDNELSTKGGEAGNIVDKFRQLTTGRGDGSASSGGGNKE
ncbi:unnamed protein product [Peniophora sp. CBMAI 1063]|nr:unnamed protein product [Peniophora sp. CBMAI 1063]